MRLKIFTAVQYLEGFRDDASKLWRVGVPLHCMGLPRSSLNTGVDDAFGGERIFLVTGGATSERK